MAAHICLIYFLSSWVHKVKKQWMIFIHNAMSPQDKYISARFMLKMHIMLVDDRSVRIAPCGLEKLGEVIVFIFSKPFRAYIFCIIIQCATGLKNLVHFLAIVRVCVYMWTVLNILKYQHYVLDEVNNCLYVFPWALLVWHTAQVLL